MRLREKAPTANWLLPSPLAEVAAPGRRLVVGDVVAEGFPARLCSGTIATTVWSPPSYVPCLHAFGPHRSSSPSRFDAVLKDSDGFGTYELKISIPIETAPAPSPRNATLESATVAREVRRLSGLGAKKLGELFPVERESYQRWVSGDVVPSSANLERLLALRHFFEALAHRVESPKNWLLAPLHEDEFSPSAYETLKAGRLGELWEAIAQLPSRMARRTYVAADGGFATRVEGSLRGRDYRASSDELDDYTELFDEEE